MATPFPTTGTMEGDIKAGLITGGVYNPNVDVSKITPTSPLDLGDELPQDNYTAILAGLKTTLPEETAVKDTEGKIIEKTKELGGEEAFQAGKEAELGLDVKKKELADLTSQLRTINTEAEVAKLQLDRPGEVTRLTSANRLDQQNIERDRTIKALRLSSSIQAVQGNIALANDQVERAVDLKYKPLRNELEVLNKQLDFNYKSFTAAEKKRADAVKEANDIKIKELDTKKDVETSWLKERNEALSNGAGVKKVQQAQALFDAGKEMDARALLAPYTGAKPSSSEITTQNLKSSKQKLGGWLASKTGSDGYVSPEDFRKARSAWVQDGYSSTDFDNQFGGYVNPGHAQDYGVKWRSGNLSPTEQILQQMLQSSQPTSMLNSGRAGNIA